MTVRPEDTLRAAGISSKRQAKYQRPDVEPPGRALVMAAADAKIVLSGSRLSMMIDLA